MMRASSEVTHHTQLSRAGNNCAPYMPLSLLQKSHLSISQANSCFVLMSQAKKAKTGASGTKVAVVTTTIYVPKCLDDYFANAVTHGHSDTLFVVTGDTKTPVEAKSFCAEASARHGVNCVFMDVEDQDAYMSKVQTRWLPLFSYDASAVP